MNIINHVYDDIKELTQLEELLSSSNSSTKRVWIMAEIKELFNVTISTFESGDKIDISFEKNETMEEVISNYSNNKYYSTNYLERDFKLSTGIHVTVTNDIDKDIVDIHLDKEYYKRKYNIKDIIIVNLMSDNYFEHKYGTIFKKYPAMIREYINRAKYISRVAEKCKKYMSQYNGDNILNIVLIKRNMLQVSISKKDKLLFDIECNISDEGIMKVIIKPTWQFKKMNRKIDKLYKPTVHFNNYGVTLKFKDCTPLLSRTFMYTVQGLVDDFNRNKKDKWIVKEKHVELIGKIFRAIEKENHTQTDNNLNIIYDLDIKDLNRIEVSARYFTIVGQELNIVDKYYEEVINYKMYESPTLYGLLLRNKKGDFEDAMYMLSRYNRTHKIPYSFDRGLLIPLRPENDLYENYVRDILSQRIDFLCTKQTLYKKEQPIVNNMEITFDNSSWMNKPPRIIITLK